MNKLVALIGLAAVLSCRVEAFNISDKDYDNLEKVIDFGAKAVLNVLDKAIEVTERFVRDNQLRTNRIEIQGHWNSFMKTAKRISVEERAKGGEDDLVVAARTLRRLVLFYKDDIQMMLRSLTTQKGIQHYIPAVNFFKGAVQRERLNEIWGDLESHYFPEAPSATDDLSQFLCYLLSSNSMENVIVNVLKTGTDAILKIRKFDFRGTYERLLTLMKEIQMKATELKSLERQKEKQDDLLVSVKVSSKVFIFYWERFFNNADSPELAQRAMEAERSVTNEMKSEIEENMKTMLDPIYEQDFLLTDATKFHFDFNLEAYVGIFVILFQHQYGILDELFKKTNGVLEKVYTIVCASMAKKLYDNFPTVKRLYNRTSDVIHASGAVAAHNTFKGVIDHYWKPFKAEAYRVIAEERSKAPFLSLPQLQANQRLFFNYSSQLFNTINKNIKDEEAKHHLMKLQNMTTVCTKKLKESGNISPKELTESLRAYRYLENLLLGWTNETDVRDFSWSLFKATVVFLKTANDPVTQAWNFISV